LTTQQPHTKQGNDRLQREKEKKNYKAPKGRATIKKKNTKNKTKSK